MSKSMSIRNNQSNSPLVEDTTSPLSRHRPPSYLVTSPRTSVRQHAITTTRTNRCSFSCCSSRRSLCVFLNFVWIGSILYIWLWNVVLHVGYHHPSIAAFGVVLHWLLPDSTAKTTNSFSSLLPWTQPEPENHFWWLQSNSNAEIMTNAMLSSSSIRRTHDAGNNNDEKERHDQIHIIFSTGCTEKQDWQSWALLDSVLASGQPGHVTRIASGCSDKEQERIQDVYHRYVRQLGRYYDHHRDTSDATVSTTSQDRFHVHFTPDYSRLLMPATWYHFFNKPFGVRHWMEHAIGFNASNYQSHVYANVTVILLDPDQILLHPLRVNYSSIQNDMQWHMPPLPEDASGVVVDAKQRPFWVAVEPGRPMGQLYGLGAQWRQMIDPAKLLKTPTLPLPQPDRKPNSSYLFQWTKHDVNYHLVAGPPYLAVGSDMYRIVATWADWVVPVYKMTTDHLSEMHAYSTAAGHQELPHQLARSMMISHSELPTLEGWDWVDQQPLNATQICPRLDDPVPTTWPHLLHYCQRYYVGPYFFSKYTMPIEFWMDCHHPLLAEPDAHIATMYNGSVTPNGEWNDLSDISVRKRMAFMLCLLIPRINRAATHWKLLYCSENNLTANLERTFYFPGVGSTQPPQ